MAQTSSSGSSDKLLWGEVEGQGHLAWNHQVALAALTTDTSATDTDDKFKDITRKHWKPPGSHCSNNTCKKKFTLIERSHHCRRCGKTFCEVCVCYKRKLNNLAQSDPDGKQHKVCQACFEEGKQNDGKVRNLTEDFYVLIQERKLRDQRIDNGRKTSLTKSEFNIETECQRLQEGFKKSIGNSEVKKHLHDLKTMIVSPEWQKSPYELRENLSTKCKTCEEKFGLLKKKHHCKVCGAAVCKPCSTKDLLLYIPDGERSNDGMPKLAIIKIVGSPSKEPEISLNLRVCKNCLEKLVTKQVEAAQKELDSIDHATIAEGVLLLVSLHTELHKIQNKMDMQLTQYHLIIESLEDNSSGTKDKKQSNIKTLAKAQEDVADFLSQYVLRISRMKKLKPETNKQAVLFKNCLKSKCDYYFENLHLYRSLKRKLEDSVPSQMLEFIQRTVDKNAIISTQLYVRQLVYESIHLCGKHNISDDLPKLLTPIDQAVEREAHTSVTSEGDDWDQHTQDMMTMIESQMKTHRLVKPSRRSLEEHGAKHVVEVLNKRCTESLQQIHVQLMLKSANRSFPQTKEVLEDACLSVVNIQMKVLKS